VTTPSNFSAQADYQVRMDWAATGAGRLQTDVDILVWVDVLSPFVLPAGVHPTITAGLTNRSASARWILAEQVRLGRRASIAIVAAGTAEGDFAVEDFLAAGALVDALATLGIDFCSPEAASAAASFTGLQGAVGHLITASVAGRELIAAGQREAVLAAGRIDSEASIKPA
jgi:phosphosulfolactate phosphohydrolase-like enzyme